MFPEIFETKDYDLPDENAIEWSFMRAVWNNDIDGVLKYLDQDININCRDGYGDTPLHVAAKKGYPRIIRALIKAGANVEEGDHYGRPPIHVAAYNGQIRSVEILLKHVSKIDLKDSVGCTALHWACISDSKNRRKIAEMLINAGANIHARSDGGDTPLYQATSINNLDLVQLLVEKGADVNSRNEKGDTVLNLAAIRHLYDIFIYLLKHGADPFIKNNEGQNAFDFLPAEKKEEMERYYYGMITGRQHDIAIERLEESDIEYANKTIMRKRIRI